MNFVSVGVWKSEGSDVWKTPFSLVDFLKESDSFRF